MFRNIFAYTDTGVMQQYLVKKKDINLEENRKKDTGGFEGEEKKGEMM